MKETIIQFFSNPAKTSLFSIVSVLTGTGTEAIAQATTTMPEVSPEAPAIIQIIAYMAAIASGIFSIANTLKCWYRDSHKKNDEILK